MVRLRAEEQILGELLGDGRAALDHAAGGGVAERGAHQPERIDAEMRVEAAVLGREHGLDEIRRQHVEPHMAAAQASLGEHGAVLGEDGHVGRPVVERGDDGIGNAGDEIDDRRAQHDAAPDRRQQGEADAAIEPRMAQRPSASDDCGRRRLRGRRRGPAPRAEISARCGDALWRRALRSAARLAWCPTLPDKRRRGALEPRETQANLIGPRLGVPD